MTAGEYRGKLLSQNFNNRATYVHEKSPDDCDVCSESLIFALATKDGGSFSLGLSTLLECLKVAENKGAIPKLSADFWWDVENVHGVV